MNAESRESAGVAQPFRGHCGCAPHRVPTPGFRACVLVGAAAAAFVGFGLPEAAFAASEGSKAPAAAKSAGTPAEVVVYVSELPKSALFEFDLWKDSASPGGKLAGIFNNGDELDPPPENDPHVVFKAQVHPGVPYRCWVHMKVGKPKGRSQANMLYAQFTDVVDKSGKGTLKPGTGSYLIVRGPEKEGWTWVSTEPVITFRNGGEVSVRLQGGMEGVGFDQVLLSSKRFLEKAPSEAIVKK